MTTTVALVNLTFNPLGAVGVIVQRDAEGRPSALGTAFAFRSAECWVTARHCVPGDVAQAAVATTLGKVYWRTIREAFTHPDADIAVLHVEPKDRNDPAVPFYACASTYLLGEDFIAYGFPESVFGQDQREPTPRLFKGYYQRFIKEYRSHNGSTYDAGEMSIPAPPGLSGGPLFRPGTQQILTGMVTDNLDSSTTLDAVHQEIEGGETRTTHYQRVITYGIALMLDRVEGWLDEYVPPAAG